MTLVTVTFTFDSAEEEKGQAQRDGLDWAEGALRTHGTPYLATLRLCSVTV